MYSGNACKRFIEVILVLLLISAIPVSAEDEPRWDPAFNRMTPVVEVQGSILMTDPCFYYLSYGSEWINGAIFDSVERSLAKYSPGSPPSYRELRLHDETLQSCYYWAQRGTLSHQYGLGLMYLNGHQVDQDYQRAYFWLELAVQSGHQLAPSYRNEARNHLSNTQRNNVEEAVKNFDPLKD